MKKILALLTIFVFAFLTYGCTNAGDDITDDTDLVDDMLEEASDWYGVWTRTATYVDGVLEGTTAATLDLSYDSFVSSTSVCTASGELAVDEENLVMSMNFVEDNCPGGGIVTDILYSYEISEDGQTMIITTVYDGVTISEHYTR